MAVRGRRWSPGSGHGHVPRGGLTRRTLLADLGRVTLGAVVLGPALAACDDDPPPADTTSTPAAGDGGGEESEPGVDAPLAWERASFGFVSAYVLVRGGEALVFDTGTGQGGVEPIATALDAAGVGWGAVSHVLVSHDHGDHVGGIEAVMAEATGATAHAAAPDLATVRDRVAVAQEVVDGDVLLGLRIVATPGHTPGHLSAFAADAGVLLTGDAVVRDRRIGGTTGEGIEASPPDFTADAEAAVASVKVLADLAPETMLFGHGDPLTVDATRQLTDYADRL